MEITILPPLSSPGVMEITILPPLSSPGVMENLKIKLMWPVVK
jgi:hypothetical protein